MKAHLGVRRRVAAKLGQQVCSDVLHSICATGAEGCVRGATGTRQAQKRLANAGLGAGSARPSASGWLVLLARRAGADFSELLRSPPRPAAKGTGIRLGTVHTQAAQCGRWHAREYESWCLVCGVGFRKTSGSDRTCLPACSARVGAEPEAETRREGSETFLIGVIGPARAQRVSLERLTHTHTRVAIDRVHTVHKFACYMWEGYTTAHRTRVRHMRHARLVCSERECKFACYLWEGTTATV